MIIKRFVLPLLLLVALALRVVFLTEDRFHADEALYAGWALRALDNDPLLVDVPVDKPPLYLYTLAASMRLFGRSEVAARLPSLASSVLGIALVYRLGQHLYDRPSGLWAALFLSLSPFDILFARTAFTDPMLVLWMLVALLAACFRGGRWFWAGVAVGLALATKQHAVTLVPLVVLLGCAARPRLGHPGGLCLAMGRVLSGLVGFAIPFALVTWWDSARWGLRPGYWRQSGLSYGGLAWAAPAKWGARLVEWGTWARYLVGSPVLYVLLVAGASALVVWGWVRGGPAKASTPGEGPDTQRGHSGLRPRRVDTVLLGYALGYVGLHTVLDFSIWDRYLLPLAPLASLLLARVVVQGLDALDRAGKMTGMDTRPTQLRGLRGLRGLRLICASVVCLAACHSACTAAVNGYPVGGEHWAYQGLDEVVAYLEENAVPDAVLYHHWLRWHYTYYLYGTGFELRWWQSAEHLRREATRTPGREQYIVLPDWRTLDPASEGIELVPLYETQRRDGSVSLQLCRVMVVE